MSAHRSIRSAAVLLVLTGLFGVAGCADDPGATQDLKYLETVKGPDFTIKMPGPIETRTVPVHTGAGDLNTLEWVSGSGAAALTVAETRLPPHSRIGLDEAVTGVATNAGGEVKESTVVTYLGHEGRDARITGTASGEDITLFGRVLGAGRSLIVILQVVEGKDVHDPPASYRKIIASLRLTQRG